MKHFMTQSLRKTEFGQVSVELPLKMKAKQK
jgi:hypothetical protein